MTLNFIDPLTGAVLKRSLNIFNSFEASFQTVLRRWSVIELVPNFLSLTFSPDSLLTHASSPPGSEPDEGGYKERCGATPSHHTFL